MVTCKPTSTVSSGKWSGAGYNTFLHITGPCVFEQAHQFISRRFAASPPIDHLPSAYLPTTHTHKYRTKFAAMRGFRSKISPVHTHQLDLTQYMSLTDAVQTNMVVGVRSHIHVPGLNSWLPVLKKNISVVFTILATEKKKGMYQTQFTIGDSGNTIAWSLEATQSSVRS